MRVLVIPDCHLKPWMFEKAAAIMSGERTDNAVCLMDIPDDFGKDDPDLYKKAYDAAIRFAKQFPQSLWCYGNHDLSYVWSKPETGFNPAVRMLVREKLEELERTLSSPSQLAYIHKIDKTLFMHGGLSNFFVHRWVTQSGQKAIGKTIKEINKMGSGLMWDSASPIWYRPQFAPDNDASRLFRGGKYLQVVGHTPVKDVILEGGVLSCDTFSTYRDGTPYGSREFCIVDTDTWQFETVPTKLITPPSDVGGKQKYSDQFMICLLQKEVESLSTKEALYFSQFYYQSGVVCGT